MPFSISTLLIRNLRDVFGENDPARRRATIDEIWTRISSSSGTAGLLPFISFSTSYPELRPVPNCMARRG
jgi:hypothetical protein